MSDIVDRLRSFTVDGEPTINDLEAADEIEKLRAQVADLTRIAGCVAVGTELSAIKNDLMPLPSEYGTNPYRYVKDGTVPVKTFDDIKREIKPATSLSEFLEKNS